jgi:hypothetical protein
MSESYPYRLNDSAEETARRLRYMIGNTKPINGYTHRIIAAIPATPEPLFLIDVAMTGVTVLQRYWLLESEWNSYD